MHKAAKLKVRPQTQPQTTEASHLSYSSRIGLRIWHRRVWNMIEFVLGAATLFGMLSFAPRFAIEPPSVPVDDSLNPFDEPFTLTNVGYLSVYDVTAFCSKPNIGGMPASGKPSFEKGKPFNISADLIVSEFEAQKLEPQDPHAVPCNSIESISINGQAAKVTFANVVINVHFKILRFIPWWTKHFYFEATLHSDGKLHWAHQSLKEIGDSRPKSTHAWQIGTYDPPSNR